MLKNYFKENSSAIKKLSLALRGLIGTLAASTYVTNNVNLAFWLLALGALLDFALQLLPPDATPADTAKKVLLIAAITTVLLAPGCKVIKPETSTIKKDSTIINYKHVDIDVPGAIVSHSVNVDSLMKAYQAAVAVGNKAALPPMVVTDPNLKAQLKIWVDQFGQLQASCESKDQTVQALVTEVTRLSQEVTKKTEVVKETPKWNWIVLGALSALLIASILLNVILIRK